MVKFLAIIGIICLLIFISAVFGTIFAMLDNETIKRERWSRSLDEKEKE